MQNVLDQRFDSEDANRYNSPALSHIRLLYLSLTDVVAFERAVLERSVTTPEEPAR